MRHRLRSETAKLRLFACMTAVAVGVSPDTVFATTYRMECAEIYNAPCTNTPLPNSCNNTDGFDVWASGLWTRLGYWQNQDAWPSDWIDDAAGGDDWNWADDAFISVWSGHGRQFQIEPDQNWAIMFGTNSSGACRANAGGIDEIRLNDSEGGHGGVNKLAVFDASCSAIIGEWESVYAGCIDGPGMMHRSVQALGFQNSPGDASSRLWVFGMQLAGGTSIKNAWLVAGGDCFNFLCEDESPLVMTKGSDKTDAINRANTMNQGNIGSATRPPCDGYYWYFNDNGGGSC